MKPPITVPPTHEDSHWMQLALAQARQAAAKGEVPVGAVVVKAGQLVATGCNAPIGDHDPTAHAEIVALRAAARALNNYRLEGCTLYVTLEPCAMCSGAMLHARLDRVVFGAPDAKTGAAGGVVNLFAQSALNHRTQLTGGVLAAESTALLQAFFKPKRLNASPVRQDALRTPDHRFDGLPDYPWAPRYISDLASLSGLRMHYLDEGATTAGESGAPQTTFLCVHGNLTWSYLYRHMVPVFLASGARVVAPDLIGFGKSDKPKKESVHTFSWHRQVLLEFVARLDLQNVVLVVQGCGGYIGLTLPMAAPHRYTGLLAMATQLTTGEQPLAPGFDALRGLCKSNPNLGVQQLLSHCHPALSDQACAAYEAPFPDRGHRGAVRAFAALAPTQPTDDGAALSREAGAFWSTQWHGRARLAMGQDPIMGTEAMWQLHATVAGSQAPWQIANAGHLVPEWGRAVAAQWLADGQDVGNQPGGILGT